MLWCAGKCLSGTVPEYSFDRFPRLTDFIVGNNLEGTLPESWSNAVQLISFFGILNSDLIGTIPASYSNLKNLTQINLSGERLTGTLPFGWLNSPVLKAIDLSNTELQGTLPSMMHFEHFAWTKSIAIRLLLARCSWPVTFRQIYYNLPPWNTLGLREAMFPEEFH
jgi:hypothetical protein